MPISEDELLDALWLARVMPPFLDTQAFPTPAPEDVSAPEPTIPPTMEQERSVQESTDTPAHTPRPGPQSKDGQTIGLYSTASAPADQTPVAASNVRIPAGSALPGGLDMVRALRML